MKNLISPKTNKLKFLLFFIVLLFMHSSGYSQDPNSSYETTKTKNKYGKTILLKIDEVIQFQDGLSISLHSFTHKHPYSGGPTKATAYITLSRKNQSEEETLSVHTSSGTTEEEYDTIHWNNYEIELKAFDYDKFIEITVTRMK